MPRLSLELMRGVVVIPVGSMSAAALPPDLRIRRELVFAVEGAGKVRARRETGRGMKSSIGELACIRCLVLLLEQELPGVKDCPLFPLPLLINISRR